MDLYKIQRLLLQRFMCFHTTILITCTNYSKLEMHFVKILLKLMRIYRKKIKYKEKKIDRNANI